MGRQARCVQRRADSKTAGTQAKTPHAEDIMTDRIAINLQTSKPSKRTRLERIYQATVQDVWDLWTTKEGIESWWGPGGFAVTVRTLDLRPGGQLLYAMSAIGPGQVEFMKRAGMPLTTEARITYTDIVPLRRLAYIHLADFIPGVEPYDVATVVELFPAG